MKVRQLIWEELSAGDRRGALQRPGASGSNVSQAVARIIEKVRTEGDTALRALTRQLDGADLDDIRIDPLRIAEASHSCDSEVLGAIRDAEARIRAFHSAAIPQATQVETLPGMQCESRYEAIEPVGLYVPGGSAVLVSTVLMLGVPATLAGCGRVVLCTPPNPNGEIANEVLAAAALCGISEAYALGGAQAIAAMAYGTESVPRCNKIFGPGNAWVTEAKLQVSLDPAGAAIDMPAGPSEVLVIADDSADPVAVAWDLLAQAEHGADSQVILLTDKADFAESVANLLPGLASALPRASVLESSLSAARIITVADLRQAMGIASSYAPEHLIINTRNARELAGLARNAGSIFIGPWTPESLGDYCSGTNHVLPTYGWARSQNALSVADFMRRFTVQEASRAALERLGPTAETLAGFEGLEAHRMAVRHRIGERASP